MIDGGVLERKTFRYAAAARGAGTLKDIQRKGEER